MNSIIAVDFDGTIVDHRYPKIGEPAPGSFSWLRRFQNEDALLILLTMRSGGRADGSDPLKEAVDFCGCHGVSFWAVNDNPEQSSWTSSRKVYAHLYIDDAAVGCPLLSVAGFHSPCVDWSIVGPAVMQKIQKRKEAFTK